MANTYYDSELTAEEIEEVLEAISGILTSANNGKVLAISNGKIVARSVQWGGGSAVVQPLSVTQNGTYNPPSGVDGYSPVVVNVSGGGSSEPLLPSEYQEVAYIETYGAEWINTDIPLYNGDMISLEADRGNSTSAQTIIGNRSNSTQRWDAGWENGSFYATNYCYLCAATVINNLNIKMLLGIYPTSSTGFYYGAYKYSSHYPFVGNLYTLRIYRSVVNAGVASLQLIAKFIPCYRKSDNVIGFYDSVNSVFYINQGTGAFGKGPDVN